MGVIRRLPTFVLVHGGFHGSWCWDLLVAALEARSFRALAPDLPVTDPSAGHEEYAAVLAGTISAVDDDVVLVGHSQGGLTIPLVAGDRRVRRLVFLHAGVPQPGRSLVEFLAEHPEFAPHASGIAVDDAGRLVIDADLARRIFFHDCRSDVTEWALPQLRPQALKPWLDPSPLEAWPATPCTYVIAAQDRALSPAACRRLASSLPGFDLAEIDAGHSSYLSRPDVVADELLRSAATRKSRAPTWKPA